jgi:hypothetical protein
VGAFGLVAFDNVIDTKSDINQSKRIVTNESQTSIPTTEKQDYDEPLGIPAELG